MAAFVVLAVLIASTCSAALHLFLIPMCRRAGQHTACP